MAPREDRAHEGSVQHATGVESRDPPNVIRLRTLPQKVQSELPDSTPI